LMADYTQAKEMFNEWSAKVYKKNNRILEIGDELDGRNMRVDQVNENKKNKRIRAAQMTIDDVTSDLRKLGLNDTEIASLQQGENPFVNEAEEKTTQTSDTPGPSAELPEQVSSAGLPGPIDTKGSEQQKGAEGTQPVGGPPSGFMADSGLGEVDDTPRRRKKKLEFTRAYAGGSQKVVKDAIAKHGLTYETESFETSRERAEAFVGEVGIEEAVTAASIGEVDGGSAAYIFAMAIDEVEREINMTTDPEALEELASKQADLISLFGEKTRQGGRFISALQDVYVYSDFKYNAGAQIEQYKKVNNGVIEPEVEKKFRDLEKQLKDADAKIKAFESELAMRDEEATMNAISKEIAKERSKRKKLITDDKKKEITTFFDSLKVKDVGGAANDITRVLGAAVWNGSLEAVKTAVLAGADVANAVKAGIDYINKNFKDDYDPEEFKKMIQPGVEKMIPKPTEKKSPTEKSAPTEKKAAQPKLTDDGRLVIPNSIIHALVESGIDNINDLTKAVHDVVKEILPDITERQVRDAITQYGKTKNLSQDEIKMKVRELKRMGKLISGLEDVKDKKKPPLRSGLQRDKPTDEERRMQKELRDAMKDLPVDEETSKKAWRTALDQVKARLTNQIADLEEQIKTGQKTPKKKGIEYDEEAKVLQGRRDDLREILQELEGKPTLSDEQRVRNAIAAAERSAAEYERRINEKDFSKREPSTTPETPELIAARAKRDKLKADYDAIKKGPAKTEEQKATESALKRAEKEIQAIEEKIKKGDIDFKKKQSKIQDTPELKDAREKLADIRKALGDLREQSGIAEKKRLEDQKKAVQRQIAEYERRISEGDFVKKKPKEITPDEELLNLKADKIAVKEQFEKLQYENELKNRTATQKAIDYAVEAWGLTRALRATAEFSFILLQGGVQTVSHPVAAYNAFKTAMSHFASESKAAQWQRRLRAQEYYNRMKESKLAITEPNSKLDAREEQFLGGWVHHIWDIAGLPVKIAGKNAYERWKAVNPIKAVERAGIGYLNTLRLTRYLQGEEMLRLQGKTYAENAQDYKYMADVINTFTGRASLGMFEQISKPLAVVFFSPRNWASIIKQTTPYAFYHFGKMHSKGDAWYKPSVAQKMALGDYMKYVGLTGAIVALVAANQDDDDDDGWKVELDARSSDFLKLRKGNTRVDPWGGRIQMIVYQARMITESMKDSRGKVKTLGEGRTSTRFDLTQKMVENKLAPSSSILKKYMDSREKKKKGETIRVDKYGNNVGLGEQIPENLYPIYWETIRELHADQPTSVALFIDFLAFLGVGSQTYESKKKKKE
jgi:hypothetical protein